MVWAGGGTRLLKYSEVETATAGDSDTGDEDGGGLRVVFSLVLRFRAPVTLAGFAAGAAVAAAVEAAEFSD